MTVLNSPMPEVPGYNNAAPFPCSVFEDFLKPEAVQDILREWPEDKVFSHKKTNTTIKHWLSDLAKFGPKTRRVFQELNSPSFTMDLERITGIEGLIPDLTLKGGGLHMIGQGGFLKMHADFNWHGKLGLMRKINLLIYLNEDWEDEWGGDLELVGPPDRLHERVSIKPKLNRAVLFNTTSDSWHGHPEPITCPKDVRRKSIALYYYAREPKPERMHSTIYRAGLIDDPGITNHIKI